MSGEPTPRRRPRQALAGPRAAVAAPPPGLLATVKVEHAPAEHTEGRQSARLDALANHRQVLRRCRSEMP